MNLHRPWLSMRRCVMNLNGTVNYYLNPTNSTLRADGTAANLTGADGYVMVEIPKFYFRHDLTGTVNRWDVRGTPAPGYEIHPAFIKDGVEVAFRYMGAYDASMWFSRNITGVTDAGSGTVTITTSAQHPLYAGDTVTIAGTTSYNGTHTVLARTGTTGFTITAAFVSSQTGTATGYVSGKNLNNFSANVQTGNDRLTSVTGQYPLVGLTRAECRSLAINNGTGWRQQDFWLTSAVQLLYLMEFADFKSQSRLGQGNVNGGYLTSSDLQTDSPHSVSGLSNTTFGDASTPSGQPSTGARPGTAFMSYRGIENFYGNVWNWVDGLNILTDHQAWATNNSQFFVDDVSTGMIRLGTVHNANGFVTNIIRSPGAFLPGAVGGSNSTRLADYYFQNTGNRVALFGGVADDGLNAGVFFWLLGNGSGDRGRYVGPRVCF